MRQGSRALLFIALLLSSGSWAAHNGSASNKAVQDFQKIDHALQALTDAVVRIGEEKKREAFASAMRASAMQHRDKAQQLLDGGHSDEARQQLDSAMVVAKTGIATLRNRETLIRSLNFAHPEDEYLYEVDRFQSYSMLINLLLERMQPDPAKRQNMESFMERAWLEQESARSLSADRQFEAAIRAQESSNKLLLRAIRVGGIYVPG